MDLKWANVIIEAMKIWDPVYIFLFIQRCFNKVLIREGKSVCHLTLL